MACRRCLASLTRHFRSRLLWNAALENTQTLIFRARGPRLNSFDSPAGFGCINSLQFNITRHLNSRPTNPSDEEEDEEEGGQSCEEEGGEAPASKCMVQRGKSEEEKIKEAAEIGYKVIGPLDPSENPFKPYEPAFAVVQIGSHQFKVSNGDSIFTERLKFCEVNGKLILNRVLMLGSKTQTIIGRPVLPDAAVHAVVEEHALDAKVIIFKKKRRKNYRRTKGHRQELTKLRITDIQGIDKSDNLATNA
ncbi:50S ribosomal protein L21, mitochondrial-like isoform X1 [Phoenix dactylifera]|uniref:Large ribosomal subunit protein bL21m n=1 Tax=Phoenix dactylifera TaxID=42345 RepID=A0A8B7C750_PHODC|nr:50S ribosomal protein L21, mitochondrial-like isoform X1 [Phoenix dactylifera]